MNENPQSQPDQAAGPTQQEQYPQQPPVAAGGYNEDYVMQRILPTKNVPSLLSYYFGVFGLIPFLGLPLSIAAIVLGFIALNKYKQQPTPGAKGHAITGLVLGFFELGVFALFLIWISTSNIR